MDAILQNLAKKKDKGYHQLDREDELEGVELIRRARDTPTNGASSSGTASADEEAAMPKSRLPPVGSPSPTPPESPRLEINSFQDLVQVVKQHEKKVRPKVIAVTLGLAAIIAVVLAFNPGGKVDTQHKKPDLCRYQGAQLPPNYFKVHNYSLLLALGQQLLSPEPPANPSFSGQANISLTLLQPSKCLLLHAAALNFTQLQLTVHHPGKASHGAPACLCGQGPGCHVRNCATFVKALSPGSDLVAIPLHKAPPRGATVQLAACYVGQVAPVEHQEGLFRSQPYPLPGGGRGVLLTMQLELTSARRLFPALDEPAYKASFTVQLAVPPGTQALSNMPQVSRGPYSGPLAAGQKLDLVTFQPTPPMPTYTLGLAVGPLSKLQGTTKRSKKAVGVWAPPGREAHMSIPLKVAVAALEYYEYWTGVELPLPKFDLVAVPGRQGAMESWGVLLFDPDRMLVNPATEGAWGVWRSADVVCHELAHQWFGNYVTCASEGEMLVNEGMASLMEYGCVQAAVPALSSVLLMNQATNPLGNPLGVHEGARLRALEGDGDPWAPPIRGSSDSQPFSVQTYSKGAALLTMAATYLDAISPGCLQVGLRQYLRQYALGSATVEDLFRSLAEACPDTYVEPGAIPTGLADVAFIGGLLQWTTAPGYPLLLVGQDDPVMLTQERFCSWQALSPDLRASSCPSAIPYWYLPMSIGPLAAPPLAPPAPTPPSNSTDDNLGADKFPADEDGWLGTHSSTAGTGGIQAVVMTSDAWELPEEVDAEDGVWVVQKGGLGGLFRVVYPGLQREALRGALGKLAIMGDGALDDASDLTQRQQVAVAAEAGTLVDDILQVALAATPADKPPHIPATEALQWMQAALAHPDAPTGVAGYSLVLPVLRALHRLADLLAGAPACAADLRRFTSRLLHPLATMLLAATPKEQPPAAYLWEHKGSARDEAFRRLLLPPLLTLSALSGDPQTAAALCLKHPPASATPPAPSLAAELLDASTLITAARPAGCDSTPDNGNQSLLARWAQDWRQPPDEATAQRALAALTHAAAWGVAQKQPHGRDILLALLGLPGSSVPLLGVVPPKAVGHVASVCHVAHLLGDGGSCGDTVLEVVRSNWEQLQSSWGSATAWQLLEEVAGVGVTTQQQYASLRQWLQPKKTHGSQPGTASEEAEREQKVLRVLSRAHAGVAWRAQQQLATCDWLAKE